MRTVLLGVAGRASLILVAAGMVGSAALPAAPAAAPSRGSAAVHGRGPAAVPVGDKPGRVRPGRVQGHPDGRSVR